MSDDGDSSKIAAYLTGFAGLIAALWAAIQSALKNRRQGKIDTWQRYEKEIERAQQVIDSLQKRLDEIARTHTAEITATEEMNRRLLIENATLKTRLELHP